MIALATKSLSTKSSLSLELNPHAVANRKHVTLKLSSASLFNWISDSILVVSGPYDMVARNLNDGDKVVSKTIDENGDNTNSVGISVTIN